MTIKEIELNCITYGKGNKFNTNLFKNIRNNKKHNKPLYGLWASPMYSQFGWIHFCKKYCFYERDFNTSFKFKLKGKILIIDNENDLKEIEWVSVNYIHIDIQEYFNLNHTSKNKHIKDIKLKGKMPAPNYEKIKNKGIDAIYLTDNGVKKCTKIDSGEHGKNLIGWDCESIFVMNKNCIYPEK